MWDAQGKNVMNEKKTTVYKDTKDILNLLMLIKKKEVISISDKELDKLPMYSIITSDDAKIKSKKRDFNILKESGFIKNIQGKKSGFYAFIDYPEQKLTALQKELQKLYLINISPQEAYLLKVFASDGILDKRELTYYTDYNETCVSLYKKKEELGYKNLDNKKFMELCVIGKILHSEILKDTTIKDVLWKLNYEINSQNIKEFKEFMLLKNPSVIFENK